MINFFDLGMCEGKRTDEIIGIFDKYRVEDYTVYGIEAKLKRYKELKNKYRDNLKIKLNHFAITDKNKPYVLYENEHSFGDSIIKNKKRRVKNKFEVSSGIKFSFFIAEYIHNFDKSLNIVKINIEGAEIMFLNDIIQHGLYKHINFLYGSYGDIAKIGLSEEQQEQQFHEPLRRHGIVFHTYFDEDLMDQLESLVRGYKNEQS